MIIIIIILKELQGYTRFLRSPIDLDVVGSKLNRVGNLIEMDSYFDPKHSGSFAGSRTFYKHSDKKFKHKQIKDWLTNQDVYTLPKPVRWHFRRRRIFTSGIDDLWQADLVDMSAISNYNDGCKFLLTCIDVFSKYAWAIPLKNKSSKSVVAALTLLLHERKPANLQTDKGTEFINAPTRKPLEENRINFYTTENDDVKASVVERFNRTLKSKMWKYFTHENTYRYVDVLNDLLHSYNNTYHRTIKMTPSEVNRDNESEIRKTIYKPKEKPKWLLNLRDRVRISKTRRQFKKGYLPNWSDEHFTVAVRHPTDPPTYEIDDYDKERVKGKFHELKLQKVFKTDDVYKVESVLKTRKKNGRKEYFVKWFGYPDKFNSWVSDIKTI